MKTRRFAGLTLAALLLTACAADDPAEVENLGGMDCPAGAAIGDACGGGIVFDNAYGTPVATLVVAEFDEPGPYLAYELSPFVDSKPTPNADGRLATNTFNADHPASWACQQSTRNGFGDWYLPSFDEMTALGTAEGLGVVPNIVAGENYWSVYERPDSIQDAGTYIFPGGGSRPSDTESNVHRVRCIRRPHGF